jgi:hypothetical protein
MKYFIYFLVICLFILAACNKQKVNLAEIECIDLNSTKKINFTDLFTDYRLIFPEVTDLSLFGIEIMKCEVYQDKIYLLNQKQSGKDLLCFNTDGKFLFSIDKNGNGSEEYTYLGDFFIDRQKDNLILSCEANECMYFDLEGNYLFSKKLPPELDWNRYTCEFNDSLFITRCDCEGEQYPDIILSDRNTFQVKYSLESDKGNNDFVPDLPIAKDRDTVLYYSRNDTIYDISSNIGRRIPICYVDMGKEAKKIKNTLALKNDEESNKLFYEAFKDQKIKLIRGFLGNVQYFALTYMEFNLDNKQQNLPGISIYNRNLFYDRKTQKSYNTGYINFDIFNSLKIQKINLIGCFDGYFYAVINDIFTKDEIQTIVKSKYLNDATKDALLNMNDMSNPIIIIFK